MLHVGIEPEILAPAAQTLTQPTKWTGQASAFSSGALAKFFDAIQTQSQSPLSEPCVPESGPPHFTEPDLPGRRRAYQGDENENENGRNGNKMAENEKWKILHKMKIMNENEKTRG